MWGDGFEISEGNVALGFWDGDMDVHVNGDSQVVGDIEVEAGELRCWDTSRR